MADPRTLGLHASELLRRMNMADLITLGNQADELLKRIYDWDGTRAIFNTDEIKEIHLSRLDIRLMLGIDEARTETQDIEIMDVDIIGEAPKSIMQLSMAENPPSVENLIGDGITILHMYSPNEHEGDGEVEHRIIASPHKLYMPEDCQNLFTPSSYVTVGAPDAAELADNEDYLEKNAIRHIKLKNVSFENTRSAREMFYAMPLLRSVEIEDCHFSCIKDIRGMFMGCQLLESIRIMDGNGIAQNSEAPKKRSVNAEYMITDTFGALENLEINCLDPDTLVKTTGPVILWNFRSTNDIREGIIKATDKLRSYLLQEAIDTKDACTGDILMDAIREVGTITEKDLRLGKLEGYKYLMMQTSKFKALARLKAEANEYKMCVRRAVWWQMLTQTSSNVFKLLDDIMNAADVLIELQMNRNIRIGKTKKPQKGNRLCGRDLVTYGVTMWSNKLSIRANRFVIGEKFGDISVEQILRAELLKGRDYTGIINNEVELLNLVDTSKYNTETDVFRTFERMYNEPVYTAIWTLVVGGGTEMDEMLKQFSDGNPAQIKTYPYRDEFYTHFRPVGKRLIEAKLSAIECAKRPRGTIDTVTAEEEVPSEAFSMYRKYVETTLALLSIDEKDDDLSLKGLLNRLMSSVAMLAEQFKSGELEADVQVGLPPVHTVEALKRAFLYIKRAQSNFKTTIEPKSRCIAKYDKAIDKYISDKRRELLDWYNKDSVIREKRKSGAVEVLNDKLASSDPGTDEYKDAEHFMEDILIAEMKKMVEVKKRQGQDQQQDKSQGQRQLNEEAESNSIDELLKTYEDVSHIGNKIDDDLFFDALNKEAKSPIKQASSSGASSSGASSSGASSLLDDIDDVYTEKTEGNSTESEKDDNGDGINELEILTAVKKTCPYCYGPVSGNRCTACHELIDVKDVKMRLKQFIQEANGRVNDGTITYDLDKYDLDD